MGIAAHDGADRADQLLGVTERLTILIHEEIEALKKGRLDASTQEWSEKEKLAHAYRVEMSEIRRDPFRLEGASAEQRTTLQAAVVKFQTALEIHAEALSAMKDVTEGLVQSISKEVAATRAAPAGYGAAGKVSSSPMSGQGVAVNTRA